MRSSHSIQAEQSLLGGLMLNNAAFDDVADIVAEPDFYLDDHQTIFAAIRELSRKNEPFDPVTIADKVKLDDWAYVPTLAVNTPSAANVRHYAKIVRDKALERGLLAAAGQIEAIAHGEGEVREKLDRSAGILSAITEQRTQGGPKTARELMPALIDAMQERLSRGGDIIGLSTGYADLDPMLSGLQGGDLIIVAGRPSMGKTTLAMNFAETVALDGGVSLMFSMEMPAEKILARSTASIGKIDYQKVRTSNMDDDEWGRFSHASRLLSNSGLTIDETPALTVLEMRARARRIARRKLDLIVVDYLQLMAGEGGNRNEEITTISRGLKALAKELNIPVVALSQLNRNLEQRPNKRPRMSDLRESGAIEQDADVILFVYRDEVYNEETDRKGIAEIIIGKQRDGELGTVFLTFRGNYCRFDNFVGELPSTNVVPMGKKWRGGFEA